MGKDQDGFARTYGVEFLFEDKPVIEINEITRQLEGVLGRIYPKSSGNQHLFFLLDHQVEYQGGNKVPAQLAIMFADPKKDNNLLEKEIQQSWQTPNAAEIVGKSKFKVLLTDIMSSGLDSRERLFVISNAAKVFARCSNTIGIVNKRTQQVLDADEFRKSDDDLFGFINIRFFNAGDQGLLMDSLGLAALGIYDVQCHFIDLDPNAVSNLLFGMAYFIFNEEPSIENGHTIEGLDAEKWFVRFEQSLVEPFRDVLDINPGPTHAAGNR